MNGWTAAIVSMILVMNPAGIARMIAPSRSGGSRVLSTTVAATGVIVVGIGLLGGPLMDALSISTPTFRLGAALVMGLTGGRWMLAPPGPLEPELTERQASTYLATLLLAPGPVLTALASTGDAGAFAGAVSVAMAFGVTLVLVRVSRLGEPTSGAVTRFIGALTLLVAIAIGLDSARSV